MHYVNLGATGLKVSRICLGCMSYGDASRGPHAWVLNEEQSLPFFKQAIEAGITFFDTANVYSLGASEEITGRALKQFARREEVVVATKVHGEMRAGDPNGRGLSRKAIFAEIDASLQRLGMDYVDLYQIHRWDAETPVEETLEALHDVVKAGKARYLGASSMWAWQFMKALALQRANGWSRFVSMQNHLNLIYREEEREMLPLCRDQGVGVIPWSPLARGRLTRPPEQATTRSESDRFGKVLYRKTEDVDRAIIDAVGRIANVRGLPRAQIALAWLLQKPGVTAPIVGATKPEHLNDAVAALSLQLTADDIAALEAPYAPHAVSGFV
ncbi:MAG: aldo/keto reductase [Hyphomonadaceae bacterium]|nr:aldo/keto reductase [Hyphomonadaceae bacterium]